MKILFVTTGIKKNAGGIQRFNSDLVKGLRELGYKVEVVVLKKFNGSHLFGKALLGLNLLIKFVKNDFDIVFYGHINFYPFPVLGKRFFKAKYIVLAYGIEVWDIKDPLKIKFLEQAEIIVSVSDFTKNKLLKAVPECREKIFVLPGAVNGKEFKIKEKSEGLIKRYGLQDKKVVLTVARLPGPERCKGQDIAIESLSEIIKSVPDINIKYLIVGTGSDMPRLKELAEGKGIKDFVIFCGFVSSKELVDYYNLADVFIMPSKKEGFGIVFLEALACGIPVIAGNKDASTEPLLNGKLGLLVDPDNEGEIAEAILKVLNGNVSKELLNRQYLREQVIENFGTDKFKQKLKILMKQGNECPLVSIVVLTHNRQRTAKMCLEAIYSQTYLNKEIIIVDNGSKKGLVEFLKFEKEEGRINLLLNGENKGCCEARNQGAALSKGEFILFIDSDVVLADKGSISKAMEEMEKYGSELGELGGIGFLDKELSKIQHRILKIDKGFGLNLEELKRAPEKLSFESDYIQSDFALLRKNAFYKAGGFDPFYFYYPEDVDLSLRIKRAGFKIAVTPKVRFWHQYLKRRKDITHAYFYKTVYLFLKNSCLNKTFNYYFYFLKKNMREAIKAQGKIKKAFLMLWCISSPVFFAWLVLFFPLIKKRDSINFLCANKREKSFLNFSSSALLLPLRAEEKILEFIGEILFRIKRKKGKIGLYLFITNKCNYSCAHCFLGQEHRFNKNELTVPEIRKTYESLRKKIGGVSITGGEPFLRKDIVDVCKIFQEPPFVSSIYINTNGFNAEFIKKKMQEILTNKPKKQKIVITISLDGKEKTHDAIRRVDGAFRNAVKTIKALKALESHYPDFKARAQFTLMKINYEEFYQVFDFITKDLGVDFSFNWFRDGMAYGVNQSLVYKPMFAKDNDLIGLPSKEKCAKVYEFLLENRWRDLNLNLINKYTLQILEEKKSPFSCVAPGLNLVLYANGDISFCELIKPFHNVRDFDYDLKVLRNAESWKKNISAVKNCCCIHPCALALSMGKKHFLDIKLENLRSIKNK